MGPLQAAPVAFSRSVKPYSPVERSGKNGSRTIRYKEYVQDILGNPNFTVLTFACNPGLSNLFTWLSGQGIFYQEYRMKRLRFCFETEKATSLSGKIMFAFQQDSSDPAPASKQEMLENLIKASGAIWQPFCLEVSMANFPALGKSRFIRSGNLAANLDVKTYDIGQLIVAVQGMADSTEAGELYIEYELELITPIQSVAILANSLSAILTGVAPSSVSLFGVTPTIVGGLDITATGNTLTFNKVGQYLLDLNVIGTGLSTSFLPTVSGITNTVVTGLSNAAANAGTAALAVLLFTVTSRGSTATISVQAQSTTVTATSARLALYAASNG